MDNYPVLQGTALPFYANLADRDGAALLDYTGDEDLTGYVTPGKSRPALFLVPIDWDDPAAGRIAGIVSDVQTAAMAPGRYLGAVILTDPALGPLVAYRWTMDIIAGPGPLPGEPGYAPEGAPAPAYITYADLEGKARGWIKQFESDTDDAGFAAAIRSGSRWLDDLIVSRGAPDGSGEWTAAGRVLGTAGVLRDALEAGGLVVEDWVRDVVTDRTLAIILDGCPQTKDAEGYAALARRYRGQSQNEAAAHTAWIRTGGPDTLPDRHVDLGAGSLR